MIREFAIVGGGIGGCSIAALLNARGDDVVLIEKEATLGGCASTFSHKGHRYNTGATTVAGYDEGGIVKQLFERVAVMPDLIPTDPGITVLQGNKTIRRHMNLTDFIDEINRAYPHPMHETFWNLVHALGEQFYTLEGHYYSNRSLSKKIISLFSLFPFLKQFRSHLFNNAYNFIVKLYGTIDPDYLDFLEAQLLIVAQAPIKEVNFFTAALALGYTFRQTHYPQGGMGALCDALTSNIVDIRKQCEVRSIDRHSQGYTLHTSQGDIHAKNLIMGTSHYESSRWFFDPAIQQYYRRYEKLSNHQSAFLVYMRIRSSTPFHHHYQFISKEEIPDTISKSLFVSLSDPTDPVMSQEGVYTLTASIHTDGRLWLNIPPADYKNKKKGLHDLIHNWICARLALSHDSIIESFAATPKTFDRYINRTQLGGNAMTRSNLLPSLPSNDTPIEGFYQVGDTAYAAQGWPGVVMGAFNCLRLIHG